MTDTVLECKSLTKAFDASLPVLKNIDLSIGRGRVVGLLGKNGAGKTTLIKCVMGLLKVSAGTARLFGQDPWTMDGETKARLGYVPQKVDLYDWMRVRQMIAYIAAFYPKWNHALTTTLVSRWELNPEEIISKMSEGQRQKLALILAMGHEPELLVLDEPAASLDPQARRAFLAAVIDVASNENRTVVLSTHLTSDLERVATDIVLLKAGEVNYAGTMDDLKDSIKTLRLVAKGRLPAKLDIPGVLSCENTSREALLTMRGVSPDLVRELEDLYSADIEVRDLNLEDIFVEVHRG
jgi:ABC-2 type transport system ATP-binding protein